MLLPGEYYCKFLLARVTNVGGHKAENCLGQIVVNDEITREFKLHWSDESWEIRRDSAPKIDLEPTESRDLDIVFSICGIEAPSEHVLTSSDEPVIARGTPVTSPPFTYDESTRLPGTLIP